MRWLSRLVSVVVIFAVVIALIVLLRSKMPTTTIGGHFKTWALFRDGSRLAIGAPVRIAGVRVGDISGLTVQGGFARIDMRLEDNIAIPVDSWVTKKAESAFGDSYVEIIPSGAEEGAPTARLLRSGEQITHVQEGVSTDSALRAISRTMPKIDKAIDTGYKFMLDARRWANGPLQDAIINADRWVESGRIEKPIDAADRAMEQFEARTTRAAEAVASARPDVDRVLKTMDTRITSARSGMSELKTDLKTGFADARKGFDRIDPTVEQMSDVMSAINEGRGNDFKGELGRLVNDPELADTIEDLSESGRDAVASFSRFKSWLGLRAEYNLFSSASRIYATAEIRARNDKFYLVEFEKGPLGGVPRDALRDAPNVNTFTRSQEIRDELRFTAQFGKTLGGWFQIRGGIKDSTVGVGADALLNQGRLRLSADLFGSFDPVPRLKLAGAIEVFQSTYILAGIDDALNSPVNLPIVIGNSDVPVHYQNIRLGRDFFLGATVHFTDEDLAALVRIYGSLIAGLVR
ncbi:MAG: Mammalian cell entry related domain protein [Myxococcales bacterium]|nr:Mammalian cell entry related domain protein [Myxococcales bacterium]